MEEVCERMEGSLFKTDVLNNKVILLNSFIVINL